MILADVMTQIATQLDTIDGLRVFAEPPAGAVPVPAAVVTYPNPIDFSQTYGDRSRMPALPVVLVIGKVTERTALARISPYCSGSGASSIKAVLEAGTYTAFDTIDVLSCEFSVETIANVENLLVATFTIDITGSGS